MPFADELLGRDVAASLLEHVALTRPGHEWPALSQAVDALDGLSLRERSDALRDALLADGPPAYSEFASLIRDAYARDEGFAGWLLWPVTNAVAHRAVSESPGAVNSAAFDDALDVLAMLTGRLTSEFAIRVLLLHDWERALRVVEGWTTSPDHHVRRLASEGTRPFLPWGVRIPALVERPTATLPVLDALYRDESEYVRRSVANHLNDVSRHHEDVVLDTARRWLAAPAPTTDALVRHALRTLVKRGHPQALELVGFPHVPAIEVENLSVAVTRVVVGEVLPFSAVLRNRGYVDARVRVDYVVFHRKANGSLTRKTFAIGVRDVLAGASVRVSKSHSFKPITTRRYHAGEHRIALQVNGVLTDPVMFDLVLND